MNLKTAVRLPGDNGDTLNNGLPNATVSPQAQSSSVDVDFVNKTIEDKKPFIQTTAVAGSPFTRAVSKEQRIKLFLWGDSGVGKTTLALQFPAPVVIDLEAGTTLYGGIYSFEVLHSNTPDEIMGAIDWLLQNKHPYKTLVIDPVTVYWDSLQKKYSDIFLLRNKQSKGYKHEFYDFQPKDWLTIKSELKEFIRKLMMLDMNVVVIAREKPQYKEGSIMVAMGETFDGEKSLPYMFDTIVRLSVRDGRRIGTCLKDRSNKLPASFEVSYSFFENLFGKDSLNRSVKKSGLITTEQKSRLQFLLEQFKLSREQIYERLSAYGAETIDDLEQEKAALILSKLETALANRR
ncbi:MAG: AAA family ATPase [Nitrospirae bacterium]|nr:AAA family ATPase [Nitrospirota bacterium]